MPRDAIIAHFEQSIERFQLPVQTNTRVLSIEPLAGKGYRMQTTARTFAAQNVVMATGFFQRPKIPAFAANLSPAVTHLANLALGDEAVQCVHTLASRCFD